MCQTRQQIIDEDPQLQKALVELKKLRAKEGNGRTRQEILEYEILIENRIQGIQTQQDVGTIKKVMSDLVSKLESTQKFPSIVYQLMKLPSMGWTLLLATIMFVWIVGQLDPAHVVTFLNSAGIEATIGDVHAVVGFVVMSLVVVAGQRYVKYVQECEEESGSPALEK